MTLTIGSKYLVIIPIVDDQKKPVLDLEGKQKVARIPATATGFYTHPVAGEAVEMTFSSSKKTTIWKDQVQERLVEGNLVKNNVQTVTW